MRRRGYTIATSLGLVVISLLAYRPDASVAALAQSSPTPAPSGSVRVVAGTDDALAERAASLVAAMTPRERAGSVVMGHVPTTDPEVVQEYVTRTGVGGFIVMGANVASAEEVPGESDLRALTRAASIDPALPALIAIDQEGGDVRRLKWDHFASSLTLKAAPPEAADAAYSGRGALLLRSGVGVNFGVVADYTADPSSFIYRRSLGTDAAFAASRVAAAVGGEAPFVDSTLKHFPGHGAAPGDSHRTVPASGMSLESWRGGEALPFRAGIDAGAQLVMFGHLAYTSVDAAPASLSRAWHDILRGELGFTGVAITDDMAMLEASGVDTYRDPVGNAVAALVAGNDMVLGVAYSSIASANAVIDGIAAAVESGILSTERLTEAAERVLSLRMRTAAQGALPCADC